MNLANLAELRDDYGEEKRREIGDNMTARLAFRVAQRTEIRGVWINLTVHIRESQREKTGDTEARSKEDGKREQQEEAERKGTMPILPLAVAFGIVTSAFAERGTGRGDATSRERKRERESEFITAFLVDRSCKRVSLSFGTRKTATYVSIDLLLMLPHVAIRSCERHVQRGILTINCFDRNILNTWILGFLILLF